MALLTPVSDFVEGVIKINGRIGGWSEKYRFNVGTNVTLAATRFAEIATARAKLLARYHSIVGSSLSVWSRTRDSYPQPTFQTGPELIGAEMGDPETCNETGSGFLVRFNTNAGRFENRLIRGLRDSWIEDNVTTLAAYTVYADGAVPIAYNPPDSAVNLLGNYLALVRKHTQLFVASDDVLPDLFKVYSFETTQYRRVGKRDLGRRLGTGRGRQASMS